MSAEAAFDALRAHKREVTGEGLNEADVAVVNALFASWVHTDSHNPTALSDGAKFFVEIHASFGTLNQSQVDGFERLLQAYGVARWPLAFAAYGLATAWRETATQMQPVEESFYLGAKAADVRKKQPYFPWYGRGDVQLTWARNYSRADDELGLGGALIANPDLALDPVNSARIMVLGMEQGWFTGKKLSDFLPLSGRAGFDAYTQARRIVNGLDAAQEIAKHAQQFEAALMAGDWR